MILEDMLPEWAYTESELDEIAKNIIEPNKIGDKKHLAIYAMYKNDKDTGIVIILAVESISDGLHAINRIWSPVGLYAEIVDFTENASDVSEYRLKHIEIVLNKYRYVPKIKYTGWNKMYVNKTWYKELL